MAQQGSLVEVGNRFDDEIGLVGVAPQILATRSAREHQYRARPHLYSSQDIRLHRIADNDDILGGHVHILGGEAHDDRARFADAKGAGPGRSFE